MKKTQFDLTTSSPDFLDESIEILKDYIYSNRACYFITLSPLDEEVLLFYTNSKQFDKSRELSIIHFLVRHLFVFETHAYQIIFYLFLKRFPLSLYL